MHFFFLPVPPAGFLSLLHSVAQSTDARVLTSHCKAALSQRNLQHRRQKKPDDGTCLILQTTQAQQSYREKRRGQRQRQTSSSASWCLHQFSFELPLKYQPMQPESFSKRLTQVLRVASLPCANHYILYEQQQKTFCTCGMCCVQELAYLAGILSGECDP